MNKIKKTYIIDDDPIYIFGLKRIINQTDFCDSADVFNNGLEAITKIKELQTENKPLPDLILLDINMPIMDGWEFIEEFGKLDINKSTIIYIISSSIDPSDYERAMRINEVKSYIVKPIKPEDLGKIAVEFNQNM
ncbi:response regulator [Mesonia sp. K7]|uniref:response regulator n=1 Tax=Mesonia sp. K7 TaxID=2218606 RepID=UPI000DAA0DDE|nr:response regulator [Mesonia sp. K7]PZD77256.1 response regulator [Mesonia sp. K7]